MYLLNSSGLVVKIPENVPTVTPGAWGTPLWTQTSLKDPIATPALAGATINNLMGVGAFSLNGRVSGVRGTIYTSYVAAANGTARTIWYLSDTQTGATNRIVLSIDTSNRPFISIRNNLGTVVALVTPTYTAIASGTRVNVFFSWDSTRAIDGSRFAILRVNSAAVPDANWATDPTTAWASFPPTYMVLGTGVGGQADANGQILSVQISDTVSPFVAGL